MSHCLKDAIEVNIEVLEACEKPMNVGIILHNDTNILGRLWTSIGLGPLK